MTSNQWAVIASVDTVACRAVVNDRGVSVTATILGGAYASGDVVRLQYDPGGDVLVIGKVGATLPPSTAPLPIPPTPPVREPVPLALTPTFTGSWRGSWIDNAIRQGSWGWGNNFGAAYYGAALSELDPDPDQPASISVQYQRTRGGYGSPQPPTIHLLAGNTPAGAPVSMASFTAPPAPIGTAQSVDLPDTWVDDLLANNAGGLGLYVASGEPYIVMDPAGYPQFSLAISYVRKA